MTELQIDVTGLKEVVDKLTQFPLKMKIEMRRAMKQSLDVLIEKVPPYPPPPANSSYRRTGTLGKSLGQGTGMKPGIYTVYGSGKETQGQFGTRLSYAKYVIDPQRQAYMHRGRWWTMDTIKDRARDKIIKIWQGLVDFVLNKSP